MSEKTKKPREFWMDKTGERDKGKAYEFEAHLSKPDDWDEDFELGRNFHVIERSYADQLEADLKAAVNSYVRSEKHNKTLEAQLKVAVECLELIDRSDSFYSTRQCDMAAEALDKIAKLGAGDGE